MNTIKKFLKYLLLFLAVYIIVTAFTTWATTNVFHNFKNYNILTATPEITVDECKVSKINGEISGKIINNTGSIIDKTYLKIDGYNKDNVLQGTKYKEIQYFHPNEEYPYNIAFNWEGIEKIDISLVDNREEIISIYYENVEFNQYFPIASLLILINI